MTRLPHLNLPGVPQHIVQRGNNRQVYFFSDEDYMDYLDRLKHYCWKYKIAAHSFVLMTNHVHLLLTPEESDGVSLLIQSLGRYYVHYINQTHGRTGTLWEGRYKSTLIDSEKYFLTVSRYIGMSPVKAHTVGHPAEYPWSSYQKNAMGKEIELITAHVLYQSLGKTDSERQEAYRTLFYNEMPDYTLEEIRDAINKAWILGEDRLKKQTEEQTGRRVSPKSRGGDRRQKK